MDSGETGRTQSGQGRTEPNRVRLELVAERARAAAGALLDPIPALTFEQQSGGDQLVPDDEAKALAATVKAPFSGLSPQEAGAVELLAIHVAFEADLVRSAEDIVRRGGPRLPGVTVALAAREAKHRWRDRTWKRRAERELPHEDWRAWIDRRPAGRPTDALGPLCANLSRVGLTPTQIVELLKRTDIERAVNSDTVAKRIRRHR